MAFSFIFVCQEGLLEIQACILAYTIRKQLGYEHEIVTATIGNVSTLPILESLKCTIHEIKNTFIPIYPEGNKIQACCLPSKFPKVFIDTDAICLNTFNFEFNNEFIGFPTNPAVVQGWKYIYDYFNLPVSNMHISSAFFYLNEKHFAEIWLENCKKLQKIHYTRQLDQISLGITLKQYNIDYKIIDPFCWDGQGLLDWWDKPTCICNPFTKNIMVDQCILSPYAAQADRVFGYKNGKPYNNPIPTFVIMQNGMLFCPLHQGKPKHLYHNLIHYPKVLGTMYEFINNYKEITYNKYFKYFIKRYLYNTDIEWYRQDRFVGNYKLECKCLI